VAHANCAQQTATSDRSTAPRVAQQRKVKTIKKQRGIPLLTFGSGVALMRAKQQQEPVMKNIILKTLSLTTFALSLSTFTGCVIVIDPNDPFPGEPEPVCAAAPVFCEEGTAPAFAGMNESGCPIHSCEPITCNSDSDCHDPNLACLPAADCIGTTEAGVEIPCDHTCQLVDETVDLCEEVDCGEGYMCVIEDPCSDDSPEATDCDERAACVPLPTPVESNPEEEQTTEETATRCYGDWDCEENERCVPVYQDGLDEDLNCGAYMEGICVSTLF